jgi:hypothetical protein
MCSRHRIKCGLFLFIVLINLSTYFFSSYSHGDIGKDWTRTYGGKGDEILHYSIVTSDNHILLVGESNSINGENFDVYIAKATLSGELLWDITFSDETGNEDDAAYSVIETNDGYIITGKISSSDGIGDDVLLLKLDTNGNNVWYKHFGGNAWDWGNDLLQLSDNSIIIAGTTQDFFGSSYNMYLIKTDNNGNEIWEQTIRHPDNQITSSIIKSQDAFLILGTSSDSSNRDSNIILMKTDLDGHVLWNNQYGGEGRETGYQIIENGNGYLIVGTTNSYGNGRNDIIVINIDSNGNIIWEKTFGSPSDEEGRSISQVSDTIMITGSTFKNAGHSLDQYFLQLNKNGEVSFNETYGTEVYDKGINTHFVGESYYLIGSSGSRNTDFSITKINLETYTLNVNTDVGQAYGSGQYYVGATPYLEIEEETVYNGDRIRYLFTGWSSTSNNGYNGNENPTKLTISNDITQTAKWQKQYYVQILGQGENEIIDPSGWYDEGSKLDFSIPILEGYSFSGWEGTGSGSYSGISRKASISVNGPIDQAPIYDNIPVFDLILNSEFGVPVGSGAYYENSWVDFSINSSIIYIEEGVRYLFDGWNSASINGYSGEMHGQSIKLTNDITENASWIKQYYLNVQSNQTNVGLPKSGWYDEKTELMLFCDLEEGFEFTEWEGTGVGSYSGGESNISLVLTSPIDENAIIRKINSYSLRIESEYGETYETRYYYEKTNITIQISPEIVKLTNTTRMIFTGWQLLTGAGYNGNKNPAFVIIESDTIQEAQWLSQYYVSIVDSNRSGWYDENSQISIEKIREGIIVPKTTHYLVNGQETTEKTVMVSEPMIISVAVTYSYTNLLNLGVLSIIIYISNAVNIHNNRQNSIKIIANESFGGYGSFPFVGFTHINKPKINVQVINNVDNIIQSTKNDFKFNKNIYIIYTNALQLIKTIINKIDLIAISAFTYDAKIMDINKVIIKNTDLITIHALIHKTIITKLSKNKVIDRLVISNIGPALNIIKKENLIGIHIIDNTPNLDFIGDLNSESKMLMSKYLFDARNYLEVDDGVFKVIPNKHKIIISSDYNLYKPNNIDVVKTTSKNYLRILSPMKIKFMSINHSIHELINHFSVVQEEKLEKICLVIKPYQTLNIKSLIKKGYLLSNKKINFDMKIILSQLELHPPDCNNNLYSETIRAVELDAAIQYLSIDSVAIHSVPIRLRMLLIATYILSHSPNVMLPQDQAKRIEMIPLMAPGLFPANETSEIDDGVYRVNSDETKQSSVPRDSTKPVSETSVPKEIDPNKLYTIKPERKNQFTGSQDEIMDTISKKRFDKSSYELTILVQNDKSSVRTEAQNEILRRGSDFAPYLIDAYLNKPGPRKWKLIFLLGNIGSEEHIPFLKKTQKNAISKVIIRLCRRAITLIDDRMYYSRTLSGNGQI